MSGDDLAARWRSIAVRVALAEGSFHLLTTAERDDLEEAMAVAGIGPERDPVTGAVRLIEVLAVPSAAHWPEGAPTPPARPLRAVRAAEGER